MSQHFLLSPTARTLSVRQVGRMSEEEAFQTFQAIRFAANAGQPFCPHCGSTKIYRLKETPIRWKCGDYRDCGKKFSVTSGTLFHSRKLPIRDYLLVIALFVNGVKGVAALQISRDLNIHFKSAFVLLHKLREAMTAEVHGVDQLGGPDQTVEIDGTYIGGDVRDPNKEEDKERSWWKRRQAETEANRVSVVVARERYGKAIPWVVQNEKAAVETIRARIARGSVVHADENSDWNPLRTRFPMMRVRHKAEKRADDGANINQAESYFSRLKRAEFGIYHRIAGHPNAKLQAYADEMAWRENRRRESNGTQYTAIVTLALALPKSIRWAGYWHQPHWKRRVTA
jgi:transposase-like protein